jgi:hypothetical protein
LQLFADTGNKCNEFRGLVGMVGRGPAIDNTHHGVAADGVVSYVNDAGRGRGHQPPLMPWEAVDGGPSASP